MPTEFLKIDPQQSPFFLVNRPRNQIRWRDVVIYSAIAAWMGFWCFWELLA